jgi:hypothetical protein
MCVLAAVSSGLSCKLCWLIAEFVLDNRFMQRISSKFLAKQGETEDEAFSEYQAILENVDLLWGAPRTVFVTNRSSIKQAKKLMEEGEMDGRKCEALISFLTETIESRQDVWMHGIWILQNYKIKQV